MGYNPELKQTRTVGNWILEWEPHRPSTVWVVSNHRCRWRRSQSAIQYDDGSWGWDYTPDKGVSKAVAAFMRDIVSGATV